MFWCDGELSVSGLGAVTGVSAGCWFLYHGALLMMMGTLACSYTVAIRESLWSICSELHYVQYVTTLTYSLGLGPTNMGKSNIGFLTVKLYLISAARNNQMIQLDFVL